MRNNIAYFEKTSSSKVIFWAKLNAKVNHALIFSIILAREENFLGFEFLVRNEEIDGHSHEE